MDDVVISALADASAAVREVDRLIILSAFDAANGRQRLSADRVSDLRYHAERALAAVNRLG